MSLQKFVHLWGRKPAISLLATFLLVIAIGTALLWLPQATTTGKPASFPDAFFTATSATCVTGLIVQDTPTYFSRFGQIVILILIQLGALGIMSAGLFFALLLGRKPSLAQQTNIRNILDTEFVTQALRMVKLLIIFTIGIELIGALFLFYHWQGDVFYALFHSISAFGNAGFSLFSNSFIKYRADLFINITITSLIIVGGLGFAVLVNFWDSIRKFFTTKRPGRLSLHTKLILVTSIILIIAGTWFFYSFERGGTFSTYSHGEAILASYFQSVTARTAGFNTVNIRNLSTPSHLFLMGLMFIGGGPGSTSGGIKVTTFVLLLIMIVAIIRRQKEGTIFKRTISGETIRKAMAIAVISALVLISFCLVLTLTEKASLKDIAFEATSAFGTVGLSTGITPLLSTPGKILISMLMLIGRLGPLSLVFLLARATRLPRVGYPHEKVTIG